MLRDHAMTKHNKGACALCGRDRAQVGKFIKGPGGLICLDCVEACNAIRVGSPVPDAESPPVADAETIECILCKKHISECASLILGELGGICPDCLDLCNEMISASTQTRPQTQWEH